ncbi:MAG TPA: hypothetical protein PKD37_05975 [Oligoflexia bacterium]|nr:hypothetical protein [Oligoflexia bacterium]HMP27508.1 hypothetical protein [Oligoflexia bacterium]
MSEQFITENEAIRLAAISLKSLNRFIEAGYIRTQQKNGTENQRLISKIDIEKTFGLNLKKSFVSASVAKHSKESLATENYSFNVPSDDHQKLKNKVDHSVTNADGEKIDFLNLTKEKEKTIDLSNRDFDNQTIENSRLIDLEIQIKQLKNLIEIQEKILDLKDDQINEIKLERAWLRERVEKLEEKSERDQILILNESQTVKQLIDSLSPPKKNLSKKGLLGSALALLGFNHSKETKSETKDQT